MPHPTRAPVRWEFRVLTLLNFRSGTSENRNRRSTQTPKQISPTHHPECINHTLKKHLTTNSTAQLYPVKRVPRGWSAGPIGTPSSRPFNGNTNGNLKKLFQNGPSWLLQGKTRFLTYFTCVRKGSPHLGSNPSAPHPIGNSTKFLQCHGTCGGGALST